MITVWQWIKASKLIITKKNHPFFFSHSGVSSEVANQLPVYMANNKKLWILLHNKLSKPPTLSTHLVHWSGWGIISLSYVLCLILTLSYLNHIKAEWYRFIKTAKSMLFMKIWNAPFIYSSTSIKTSQATGAKFLLCTAHSEKNSKKIEKMVYFHFTLGGPWSLFVGISCVSS